MLLFYIYIAAFIVGGILLGASLLLGHHDADGDAQLEAEAHLDGDAQLEGGDAVDAGAEGVDHGHDAELSDFWLPFVSVRFWVFFLCFFGLTGTVFTLLALASKWVTLLASVAMGLVIGFAAAFILQRLKRDEVGTAVSEEELKGQEGTVILPLQAAGKGKIRLEMRGQIVDLVARSEDGASIARGTRVLVIDLQENEAIVVCSPDVGGNGA